MYIFKQLQRYTSTCSTHILIKMVNDNSFHDDVTADVKYHVWLTFLCVFSDGTNVEILILITVKGTWFLQKYIKIQIEDGFFKTTVRYGKGHFVMLYRYIRL